MTQAADKQYTSFRQRWRAWGRGLNYLFWLARSMRVRVELVLEIQPHDLEQPLDELESALPGWTFGWCGTDRIRCVPPAFRPQPARKSC